jgi:phage baseplate assembly protein V
MRPLFDLPSVFADHIRTAEAEANRVYEAMIGIVTDNKDPQKLGRVKVKLPVLSDQDTTPWATVVSSGAGKNRGWFFIPEVNDEVLVLFEHGDIDRPVIVGALWNGKDKPPDKNDGQYTRRMIKSRQGSKITFDDDKGTITLEDGTGKGKITIDAANNKIIIEAIEGDVCFQSPQGDTKIVAKAAELKAQNNLEIHAGSAMAWGTDADVKINGQNVTMSGATANQNCGNASAPTAPTATPKDVEDPYGS